jgi:hypothetical protein
MTTMHPARKRLLIGVLLLLGTFFYAFAGTCGLIGELVARISGKLLGQTGSTLLALTMLVTGILLVVPHGAVAGFFRWIFNGREARVARIVHEGDRTADLQRIVDAAIKRHADAQAAQGVAVPAFTALQNAAAQEPVLSPTQRRKLDSVRGALKNLGFKAYEYDPIVSAMDPTASDEVLLRSAIKQLTVN